MWQEISGSHGGEANSIDGYRENLASGCQRSAWFRRGGFHRIGQQRIRATQAASTFAVQRSPKPWCSVHSSAAPPRADIGPDDLRLTQPTVYSIRVSTIDNTCNPSSIVHRPSSKGRSKQKLQ